MPGRGEFVGSVAPEAVQARYVGKSVRSRFSRGAQNPDHLGVPDLSLIGAWAETRRLHHASLWSVAVDVETFGQRRTHQDKQSVIELR